MRSTAHHAHRPAVDLEVERVTVCVCAEQVVVQARKPDFWAHAMPLYEVVTPDGLMRPAMDALRGGLYCGGSAMMVRRRLHSGALPRCL